MDTLKYLVGGVLNNAFYPASSNSAVMVLTWPESNVTFGYLSTLNTRAKTVNFILY